MLSESVPSRRYPHNKPASKSQQVSAHRKCCDHFHDHRGPISPERSNFWFDGRSRDELETIPEEQQPAAEGDVVVVPTLGRLEAAAAHKHVAPHHWQDDAEVELVPRISVGVCLVLVVVDIALVGITAVLLVDSIDGLVEHTALSQEWVSVLAAASSLHIRLVDLRGDHSIGRFDTPADGR